MRALPEIPSEGNGETMSRRLWILLTLPLIWGLAACRQDPGPAAFVFVADQVQEQQGLGRLFESAVLAQGMEVTVVVASEDTEQARLAAIDSAVSGGAKGILCVGEAYASVIYEVQKLYSHVMFLLLDGEPRGGENQVYETAVNTHCVLFREEQAGFLAGYGAVREGYRSLGYCAGAETGRTMRYGYGFVQGADTAAADLGLSPGEVLLHYWYAGEDAAEVTVRDKMTGWYIKGVELVLGCDEQGVAVTEPLIAAAEAAGGKVMVTDWDRYSASPAVLATAAKEYVGAVRGILRTGTEGIWSSTQAGQTETLGVAEGGVALLGNAGLWQLERFSQADSRALLERMARGELAVDTGTSRDSLPATALCSLEEQGTGGN